MLYNFDRVSDRYDATRVIPSEVAGRICRWVLSRLPKDPVIAEVGIGTGRIAVPFIASGIRYSGFDISEQMLNQLKAKLGGDLRQAQLFLADITEKLPVPLQSQDAVMAVHILHLVNAPKALAQIRRVLKPHGALMWGYEHHDELSPRYHIRQEFRRTAAERAAVKWRDFGVPEGRRLLAEWGAQVAQHTVAVWAETETPREVLATLQDRLMSFTWELDQAVLDESVRVTEAWARREYGDLDRSFEVEKRFLMDWYQF